MPTYEYVCKDCGEHLEVVQSFKDAALTECLRCGGQLRKVFSPTGIIFKGSGYYVTDSRAKPADTDKSAKTEKTEKTEKTAKAEQSTKAESGGASSGASTGESRPPTKSAGSDTGGAGAAKSA